MTRQMARRGGRAWGLALALVLILTLFGGWLPRADVARAAPGAPSADNTGTDFWLAFPRVFNTTGNPPFDLIVTITGAPGTTGTVAAAGLAFSQEYTLDGNGAAVVIVPDTARIDSNGTVETKGVGVTASAPVTVHGHADMQYTSDGYLALPTAALGTNYRALTYPLDATLAGSGLAADLTIVGTAAATTVTITPAAAVPNHPAGVPFQIALGAGQTYRIATTTAADLTGTIIVASQPIGVFSGNDIAYVPGTIGYGERLVEQLPPVDTWRDDFFLVPFLGRTSGYIARILAATNGTEVRLNGTLVATLNAGQVNEQNLTVAARITTSRPVLVGQYAKGGDSDGTGDPTMILAAAPAQWRAAYTFRPPTDTFGPGGASQFAAHTVNLIVRTAAVGTITLDGVAIPAASFTAIGSTGYSYARIPVVAGRGHTLAGPQPFGAVLYGFNTYVAYGYPLGLALRTVTTLAVVPATGTYGGTTTLSATLTDSATGGPLAGKTVTFTLNGTAVCGDAGQPTCPQTNASGTATLANVNLTGIGGGTYPGGVSATFAGEAIILPSTGTAQLTVNRAAQTLTFEPNPLPDRTFGDPPFAVVATATSGLPVTFAAAPTTVCTASGTNGATITLVGAGTCTVTASQAGDSNYAAAAPIERAFTVAKAAQTITFGTPAGDPTYRVGDTFTVDATASSGLPVTFAASGPCTISGTTVTTTGGGTCTITASQPGDGNYLPAPYVPRTFGVDRVTQAITFNPNPLPDKTLAESPVTVAATASSGLAVTFSAAPASVCTASGTNGSTITLVGVGTCTVTATQAGDGTYAAATPVARPFAVAPAPVGVTVTVTGPGTVSPGTGSYPPGPLTLTATPQPGALFTGWRVDGVVVGWDPILNITATNGRVINARFAARPAFGDVAPSGVRWDAITQLAARGIIKGYSADECAARGIAAPCFGPGDTLVRAQMAALIVRALGWETAQPGGPAPFSDLDGVDPELQRAIAILAQRGIAQGYGDGTYGPADTLTHAQAISLISRSMVQAGYWTAVTPAEDDGSAYPNVTAASGHRYDLLTFVKYAGALPDRPANQAWADWQTPASRGWTAQILWQALDSYFRTNRVP